MPGQYFIYGLFDPVSDELRYVGKTCSGMKRPNSHMQQSMLRGERTHKANWIRSLLDQGLRPEIVILEEYKNGEALAGLEDLAIEHYRSMGFSLTNCQNGGKGSPGRHCSLETRAKLAEAMRQRKPYERRPEHLELLRNMNRGRVVSAETRAKISASRWWRKAVPKCL